jgi:carbonic anhydrase
MLADGNGRFTAGGSKRPHQDPARLCDTFANGQHPYAAVLSCADSRVPPELVFDAGIGDLSVVRVAGNVADVDEIGTLEYGVEHLGINAVLVMGHTKCGAVTAVVEHAHVTKSIERLVDNIVPAAEEARRAFPQLSGPQLVGKAIETNVRRQMADLVANSDVLREAVRSGKLMVVGGVYDLHTGEVNWLEALSPAIAAAPSTPREAAPKAAPTEKGHAGPAVKAANAAPANGGGENHENLTQGDAHGSGPKPVPAHAGSHDDAKHEGAHGEDDHAKAEAGGDHAEARPAKKENFVALGGLIAGSGCLSFGVIHFMKSRQAAGDGEDETTAAPEEAPPAGGEAATAKAAPATPAAH